MRLMIVDDSSMVRNRIARIIVNDGGLRDWQIVGLAPNGHDAIRLAERFKPEAVTIDLTMPGMDGVECIPQLIAAQPHCAILVVSALNDQSTAIRAVGLGARGFLQKPFTDAELKNALLELVAP